MYRPTQERVEKHIFELKNIKAKRVNGEYPPTCAYFFKLVLSYFALLLKLSRLESR
jgi:hypothetical protein